MLIRDILNTIKNTSGAKAKREFLNAHMNPTLELIFSDTYDHSRKYYVHKYDKSYEALAASAMFNLTLEENYMYFHDLLDKLATREWTGNYAIEAVEVIISQFCAEDRPILHAILDRNLKIGLSAATFNKTTDSKIEHFEVTLACNLDKVKGVDPIDGTWFASRKLDGVRCIAIVDRDSLTVEFLSRQGKPFTSLKRLEYPLLELTKDMTGKIVFDGELCFIDEDGNENFSKAIQKVTKKDTIAEDVRYCVFDMLPYEVFESGKGGETFSKRFENYINLYMKFTDPAVQYYISPLAQERIETQEQFDKWTGYVKEFGWEGFMLRRDLPYEKGRIKDLLKVKKFQDAEYVVEGVETGKVVYNEGGMKEYDVVRAIIINHKGNRVSVGSGLSKEQRIEWFKDPSQIIGKTVTVQYFEETTNKQNDLLSLRFPVLKHVYEEGRNC